MSFTTDAVSGLFMQQPSILLWFIIYEKIEMFYLYFFLLKKQNRGSLDKNPLILKINSWRKLSLLHFSCDVKLYIQVLSRVVPSDSWIKENYIDFDILEAAYRFIHIIHWLHLNILHFQVIIKKYAGVYRMCGIYPFWRVSKICYI